MFGVPIRRCRARCAAAPGDQFRHHLRHLGVRLANQLGIAREEASAYIKKYFERFPGIRAYMDETREFCRKNGYVTTLSGRKCYYPDIRRATPRCARSTNAPRSTPIAGVGGRHHSPRHDPHGKALAEKKLSAQMLLQVQTN